MRPFSNILFARDFTPGSAQAAPLALRLAHICDATLHVFYADSLDADPFASPPTHTHTPQHFREQLKQLTEDEASVTYDPGDVRMTYAVKRGMPPVEAVLAYAHDHAIDLIVMGTHGRQGLRRWLLGSVAEEVVRRAPCPVLTVRETCQDGPDHAVDTILCPVDFGSSTPAAIRQSRVLAALLGARLALLHVIEPPVGMTGYGWPLRSDYDVQPSRYAEAMARLKETYHRTGGPDALCTFTVRTGAPSAEIVRYAEEIGADLIAMATSGRTGADRLLLGSVAESVARRAPCGVYLHRLTTPRLPQMPGKLIETTAG